LIPICEANAGGKTAKEALAFSVVVVHRLNTGDPVHFCIRNSAGRELHNVTLYINSNISSRDEEGARKHYVFIPTWKPRETIEIPPVLVDSLFPTPRVPIKNKGCLSYSLWCDELRQEASLDLILGPPQAKAGVVSSTHRLVKSKR
jgi:hypothetical protein